MPAGGAGGLFLCLQKFSKRIFLSVEAVEGVVGQTSASACRPDLGLGGFFLWLQRLFLAKKTSVVAALVAWSHQSRVPVLGSKCG